MGFSSLVLLSWSRSLASSSTCQTWGTGYRGWTGLLYRTCNLWCGRFTTTARRKPRFSQSQHQTKITSSFITLELDSKIPNICKGFRIRPITLMLASAEVCWCLRHRHQRVCLSLERAKFAGFQIGNWWDKLPRRVKDVAQVNRTHLLLQRPSDTGNPSTFFDDFECFLAEPIIILSWFA